MGLIYFVCVWVLSVCPLLESNHEILMRNLYHLLVCESCLKSFSHWQMFACSNSPFDLILAENGCDFRTGNRNKTFFRQIFGGVPCLFVRVYPTVVSRLFIYVRSLRVANQFRFIVKVNTVIRDPTGPYSAPTLALNVKTWPIRVERVVGGVSVSRVRRN